MGGDLAPGFLIASPPLGDPNFERTVVLLALHGPRGALGFVINRAAPMKLGEVMGLAGYGPKAGASPGAVLVGGPVEPGSGWILCGKPELTGGAEGAIDVTDAVKITSSRVAFDVLAKDLEAPPAIAQRRLVLLGYSGWGPGQLEGEIAHGAWLPAPFDERVLFDVELSEKWEAAYALLGVSPAMSIGMRTVGQA